MRSGAGLCSWWNGDENESKEDKDRSSVPSNRLPSRPLRQTGAFIGVAVLVWLCPAGASAVPNYAAAYLLIGTGPQSTAVAAKTSNWELGSNSASSPWFDTENLPNNALEVQTGVGGNGDTAITHANGSFDF